MAVSLLLVALSVTGGIFLVGKVVSAHHELSNRLAALEKRMLRTEQVSNQIMDLLLNRR